MLAMNNMKFASIVFKAMTTMLLVLGCLSVFSLEICNDGIDNDSDGLIDLNDTLECPCTPVAAPQIIPNPSFESNTGCPTNHSQTSLINTWQATIVSNGNQSTPDYYNSCGYVGPAVNGWVIPTAPFPDGDSYVGFLNDWQPNNGNYNENIGTCLTTPFLNGVSYTMEFYIAYGSGDLDAEISLYGAANCGDLPYATNAFAGCPTTASADWIELGSVTSTLSVGGDWKHVAISFTPTADVNAIILGPPCDTVYVDRDYYYLDDITIASPSFPYVVSIDSTGSFCAGTIQLTATVDSVPISYQWYADGVALVGETSSAYNVPGGNTGDYQVVVTYVSGCFVSDPFDINDELPINYTLTTTNMCSGSSAGVIAVTDVSGGVSPYQYQFDAGGFGTGFFDSSATVGAHTVEIMDAGYCSVTLNTTVSTSGAITFNYNTTDPCSQAGNGSMFAFPASGGNWPYQYQLDNDPPGSNRNFTGLPAGIYTITAIDDGNCTTSITDTITYEPVSDSLNNWWEWIWICQGDTGIVFGNQELTTGWYTDTTFSTGAECDSILSMFLYYYPLQEVFDTVAICFGDSMMLEGQYQNSIGTYVDTMQSSNVPIYTGTCSTVIVNTTIEFTDSLMVQESLQLSYGDSAYLQGDYQLISGLYYDTISGGGSCDTILETTLTISNIVLLYDTVAVIICPGDSAFLEEEYQFVSGAYNDTLESGLGFDSLITTTNLSVSGVVANMLNPYDTVCMSTGIVYNTQNDANPYPDVNYHFYWGDGDSTVSVFTWFNFFEPHFYADTGTYIVQLIAENPTGTCLADTTYDTLYVNLGPTPFITTSVTNPCFGVTTNMLDATILDNAAVVDWQWVVNYVDTFNTQDIAYDFEFMGDQYIELQVTDADGCIGTLLDVIDVHGNANALDFTATPGSCDCSTFDFTSSGTATSFSWDFADGNTANGASTTNVFATPGLQSVVLTGTDALGCEFSQTHVIDVCPNDTLYEESFSNNNWFFGKNQGVTFNSGGSATYIAGGQIQSIEGSAAMSHHSTGDLLFYSDADKVWDANHNVMPNGTGFISLGGQSTNQGTLIVPMPGDTTQYYIFMNNGVTQTASTGNEIRTSVVDMDLNNGLGDIVPASKNTLIRTHRGGEAMSGTTRKKATCSSDAEYWVTHMDSSAIYLFLVDNNGVNLHSVTLIDSSGIVPTPGIHRVCNSAFSKSGGKFIVHAFIPNTGPYYSYVYDFNTTTGVFSNPYRINTKKVYGSAFSPDESILYVTANHPIGFIGPRGVYQYDLNAPSISASRTSLGTERVSSIWTGDDGKIYVTLISMTTSFLGTINNPNVVGTGCNYVENQVPLSSASFVFHNLQNIIPLEIPIEFGSLSVDFEGDTTNCLDVSFVNLTDTGVFDTCSFFTQGGANYLWDFGDGNTSTLYEPIHSYVNEGTYDVKLVVEIPTTCSIDSITIPVTVANTSNAGIGTALQVCETDASVDLFALITDSPNGTGTWSPNLSTGTGVFDPSVDTTGIYFYIVSGAVGCSADTAQISVVVGTMPNAGSDGAISLCVSSPNINLMDSINGADLGGDWSPAPASGTDLFDPAIDPAGAYTYVVSGLSGCVNDTSELTISIVVDPNAGTGGVIDICSSGISVNLFDSLSGSPNSTGVWFPSLAGGNLGSFDPIADQSGDYIYMVAGVSGCQDDSSTVTVNVTNPPSAGASTSLDFCVNGFAVDLATSLSGADIGGVWSPAMVSGIGVFDPAVDPAGDYSYVVNGGVCDNDTAHVTIVTAFNPTGEITATDDNCGKSEGNISVVVTSGSIPFTYEWDSGESDNEISNLTEGIYTLILSDGSGCTTSYTTTITNNEIDCGYHVYLANVFTPNGDGENDVLYVQGKGVDSFELTIYNRWGNKVFETSEMSSGWDGTYNEKEQDNSVFVYVITATFVNGNEISEQGNISIIK